MHAVAGSGLRGPGRAHRARTDPTLRPIPAGARRPGGGGGDRAAQSDPRLREPRWAPGRPGGEGAAPRAGLGSLRLRPGGGGLEGGPSRGAAGAERGAGAHGAADEIPQQVQRPSPARSARTAEPPGAPRPAGQISERRGAAPRVSARRLAEPRPRESRPGPARSAPSSFSSPRPRPATPLQLRVR